jgi:hypothetical protein
MVMAVFAYIYYQSFVRPQDFTVEMILEQVSSDFSFWHMFLSQIKKKGTQADLLFNVLANVACFGGFSVADIEKLEFSRAARSVRTTRKGSTFP